MSCQFSPCFVNSEARHQGQARSLQSSPRACEWHHFRLPPTDIDLLRHCNTGSADSGSGERGDNISVPTGVAGPCGVVEEAGQDVLHVL